MKNRITIHASMTPPSETLTRRDLDRRDRIYGYAKIGYHYVIRRDGTIEIGRSLDEASMHDKFEECKTSIAVCLIGGADDDGGPDDNFTDEQWDGLHELVRQLGETRTGLTVQSRTPSVTTDRAVRNSVPTH